MKELRDYSHSELIAELSTRLATGPAPEPAAPAQPAPAEPKQWPAICAACNKATTVPFEPNNKYPIYCIDCYYARKEAK